MRGSTPLDVAASSVMDNNGLALALEEPDLDKVRRIFAPHRVDLSSFCGGRIVRLETDKRLCLPCAPAGGDLPGRLRPPELPHAAG